ncbi:MAG: hypothetical protein JOS17DRAFT_740984 [Linnemannia elongata]|nr:MAG: hypothetical protein JOS17DRAFT_740984 [Linnemannia elongata]
MPSSAYFPCLEQEMSGGDEEREDGSGYAGDEDTNSAGEDNYKDKDDSVIAVMPSFSPLPSILNESSDNYSASSTQYFPPMLGMLNDSIGNCNAFTQYCPPPPMMPYNDYISNSTEENEDNTATVVDDDRPPSQTEITSITITSGNDDDDSEEDSSTERRSIADQMAIWGCVQYLGLEGRWDQVAVALGLESCPRVWELLESEYHRLRALKESGELSDREY